MSSRLCAMEVTPVLVLAKSYLWLWLASATQGLPETLHTKKVSLRERVNLGTWGKTAEDTQVRVI